eukprot:2639015-Rhodomonas_salina.1
MLPQLHPEHALDPSTRQVDSELRISWLHTLPDCQVPDGRCPRMCCCWSSAEQYCSGPVRGPEGHRGTWPSQALRVPAHWH